MPQSYWRLSVTDRRASSENPLTENGRRLQGLTVGRLQHVHPGLDKALNGAGHGLLGRRLGAPEQLFQKQRVAVGAVDTGQRELVGGIEELRRQRERIPRAAGAAGRR